MSFETKGTVIAIEPEQTISDKFRKREFVIEVREPADTKYPDLIKFQATQDKCDLLNPVGIGQQITVSFNLRGRKYEKDGKVSYFTNLEAWRIVAGIAATVYSAPVNHELPVDNLPSF